MTIVTIALRTAHAKEEDHAHGLGVAGWSPLAGGLLTGKYRRGEEGRATTWNVPLIHAEDSEQRHRILDRLEAIAGETDTNPGRVALAWVAAHGVIPIIGPRTREQLDDNVAATQLRLSDDQVRGLDEVSAISLGYPHDFFRRFPDVWDGLAGGKPDLVEAPADVVS